MSTAIPIEVIATTPIPTDLAVGPTPARNRQAILVLGMHRSGTSSVAGVFARMGAETPATLMAATQENERGFYESAVLTKFNDDVLAAAGSHWADWRTIDPDWLRCASAGELGEAAKAVLRSEFAEGELIVVKDPRICRLAEFWLPVLDELGTTPLIVTPLRSPLEVAQSVTRRNGIPVSEAIFIWLRHVLDAELATRGRSRTFVLWDEFLGDWRGEVERMSADLGFDLPLGQGAADSVDAFLSDSLRHEQRSVRELATHRDVHPWALTAFLALRKLCDAPNDPAALAELDHIRSIFDRTTRAFSASYGHLVRETDRLTDSLGAAEAQIRTLAEQLERERAARKIIEKSRVWRLANAPGRLMRSLGKRWLAQPTTAA